MKRKRKRREQEDMKLSNWMQVISGNQVKLREKLDRIERLLDALGLAVCANQALIEQLFKQQD